MKPLSTHFCFVDMVWKNEYLCIGNNVSEANVTPTYGKEKSDNLHRQPLQIFNRY